MSVMVVSLGRKMDLTEYKSTEAYASRLRKDFHEQAEVMRAAKVFGNVKVYLRCVERIRELYRELAEVEVALMTGILPQ